MLLTLPAAFGLYVLAEPTVNVLFERGAFAPSDTAATAAGLRYFCFGLPALFWCAPCSRHFLPDKTPQPDD